MGANTRANLRQDGVDGGCGEVRIRYLMEMFSHADG